uniref:FAT atypical cadherin 2 n=1 Tax=Salarias fasciatus TaxID=181472 RepID=A0A672G6Z9_SALFA
MAASGRTLLALAAVLLQVRRCDGIIGKPKGSSPLRFTHHLYNATINENSAPRVYVETPVKMGIQMIDPFWNIKYEVVSGDADGLFQAEALSVGDFCFLRIKTRSSNSAHLNREVTDSYTLTVEAIESTFNFQAKAKVIIQVLDTNDLKPLFYPASYNVAIREDTPLKSSVTRVSATDADVGSNAEFYYSFTSRAHPFIVDPFTGTVNLAKKLNHSRTNRYDLTVLAEDRTKKISGVQKFGNVAKVTVNVQKMHMKAPVINPPSKPIFSSDGGVTINVHVEAGVRPVESLLIVGGDPHKYFEVIPSGVQGSDFQVISTKKINWALAPLGMNLSLQAKDWSVPSLLSPVTKLYIPAYHYSPLAFMEDTYIVTLSEFSPPQTFVVRVSLTSSGQNVTFSIKNNPDTSKFKMNPRTGIIVTTERFDYETKDRYEFDVVANHGEAETHIVVEITDENDNSPQFTRSSFEASLDENSPIGSSVLKVSASDKDNGKNGLVTYAIANSGQSPFTIDPFTGVISTSEHLDYELMKRRYHLRIWALDSGAPFSQVTECPVTITLNNINDNVPLFERVNCNLTVPPDLMVGHAVVQLSAIDLDELQQLQYFIESGNEIQAFAINSSSGAVTLQRPIPPNQGSFTLRVVASDGKHRSEASVVRITVTNRGDESVTQCRETGIVKQLTDKLIETIKPDLLSVEEDTFSDIHITNRHSPKFDQGVPSSIDLSEDHPLNSTIIQVKATDLDSGFNSQLVYTISGGNEDSCFSIHTFTGDLQLVCPLDREAKEFYILNVTVFDLGFPQMSAWKLVAVNVLDVNDSPPVFEQQRYVIHVSENTEPDSVVFTARTVDPDADLSGSVAYSLLTPTDAFRLDEVSGELTLTAQLDRENSPRHDLWIEARDQAKLGSQLFSVTSLVLVVQDVNDNPPKFLPKVYKVKIPEDVPVGTLLVWMESMDPDLGSGGLVTYNLKTTMGGTFQLDPSTGALTLERELDFERRPSYNLTVRAVDHGLPRSLSSSCIVEIQVLDVNENLHRPVFSEFVYEAAVMEDAAVGTSVVTLTASDKDLGRDGVVRYFIQDGSGLGVFAIDQETGVIQTKEKLDRELKPHYWLSVSASDLGTEPLVSWTHVFLEVLDVNDNAPELSRPVYFAAVMENEGNVSSVIKVSASDMDSSSEGKLSFSMLESQRTFFSVDPKTGQYHRRTAGGAVLNTQHYTSYCTKASDQGGRPLSSMARLDIEWIALPPPSPEPITFEEPHFPFAVMETEPVTHMVGIITTGTSRQKWFDIIGESVSVVMEGMGGWWFDVGGERLERHKFMLAFLEMRLSTILPVDSLTGVVSAAQVRDQEIPVKRNFAKVEIQVEDCNDHSPAFLSPRYEASISNRAPAGSLVLRVTALDKDTGSNADIGYSLLSGNTDSVFSIDPELGSITVSKPLDLQPQDQFHLTVKATDQGFPQRSDLCSVQIHIHVSDLTPPSFPPDEYLTEVSESSAPGSPVVTVSASSPTALHYEIEDGNPDGIFSINPTTGLISTLKHLDFEERDSYKLKVTASTASGASSTTLVYIYVTDENDNAPVFQQKAYVGRISESAPVNSMVMGERSSPLVIQASDADRDSNSLLVYQILEADALKVFKIDSSTGTISLISPVDFETRPRYHFSVQVKDSGEPALFAAEPAKVTVQILDQNDCSPKFTEPQYELLVLLPAVRHAEVGQVVAHDADSAVLYSIAEGNLHNAFSIHPDTGVLTVSNVSEFSPSYQLVVKASDGLFKDSATVRINTTNLTTTDLRFEQQVYSTSIHENLRTVKTLLALRVIGSFLNEPVLYSVMNPVGKFTISQTSGVLENTGIPFDREEQDAYEILVKAEDMRTPPRTATAQVKVFIDDVNDNPPQFLNLPFSMVISEDTEPGDVLYQATAIDQDMGENGSVMYALEDDYNLFRIDPAVGDVSLQRPLDFEALNKYVLTVIAADEGEPSLSNTAQLSIQVRNRTNPVFQTLLYPLKVPENVPPFTTILHVQARNPEGYRLIYNLEEENASKHFHVDFKTGVLIVTNPLDYETETMHVLTVRASDSVTGAFSEASIEVEVEDVNDNEPVFSKPTYSMNIAEGLPIGTSVIQVSASDRDSGRNKDLTFQIIKAEEDETDFFDIDPKTGWITTKQVLDYESRKQFILKVKVVDNGTIPLSSEASVFLNVSDVNDNPPDFVSSQYEATVDEMAKCGHIVIKIQASDPDTTDVNNLKYKILSGNEGRYFNINESSGIISFSNVCRRNLDPQYNLTVAVSDGVFQKTAPVSIDMVHSNRHSPYFKQSVYEAELAENAQAGTRVIRLAAIDPDDGPYGTVDYTIINKLADDKFSIHRDGQIVTTQPLDRENPTQRVIAIKVMAKDGGGRVAFCTVKIILTDQNDNMPQFKASEYQVSIQSTVNKGSPVIQIMAYDADDGKNADVTYTVDEAEEVIEDVIEINPFTGVVSVKESLLGMENKIFNFKVKARDGSLPFHNSTVPVQLKVVPPDVPLPKFSEPLYTFSAAEDIPMGSEIGSVRADSDMPLIYSLVNGNTVESNKDKVFSLDKESGTLLLQKTIDHEKTKWYQIDVIAQGNHNGTDVASLVSVSIQVQDVNDNQPIFDASPYRAFLAENLPAGTTVIQVTANDPDTDTNGLVTYSLQSLPDDSLDINEVFTIDGDSGWITTVRETDCEVTRLYRFHVLATDHGGDVRLSSSVLVEVMVTDENDNAPRFSEEVYHGSVEENHMPFQPILTMTTTDADVSLENRLVTCYITDGDPLGQFAIVQMDEGEWGLILKETLDRELKDRYTLKVRATDGKFEAPITVDVHVLDINDNSPQCEQVLYTETLMENSPPGMFVLKVSAWDPDVGANGQISYTLHGPHAERLHLGHSGELFTLAVLDREKEMELSLVVKATDGGGRSCQADVQLLVQDMNDNPPLFSSSHYQVTVFDNTTARTPVAVVYASDPDAGKATAFWVRYSLLSGDGGFFSLDEFSGILRLEQPLTSDGPSAFELKVKATDRGLPRQLYSVATVTVDVVSLDDYQPVFLRSEYTAQLPESSAVGSEVLSVSALSGDGGGGGSDPITYRIMAGNEDRRFRLDPQTGLLTLISPLDYEVSHHYFLSVEGSRGRTSVTDVTTVMINVTDVNDNTPTFGRGDYSAQIPEDLTPGSLVLKVTATDQDGPVNNLLRYSIASGDLQQQFSIHPRSGEISVRTSLDREEVPHYSLTVQAADEGDPPLSSAVLVTITVADVNDNPPIFSQVDHSLLLQEGEAVGSGVLQLVVTDRDTPANGPPFSFFIVSGNEDRRFHVDQGGLLSLSAPLRRKVRPQHRLKIQVTDSGHPPLSSICVVSINVTEQSRYPPSVVPLEVFITTSGGLFSHRVVGRLHASDQDLHDVLSYQLLSESPAGRRFSVDPADGRIWANDNLQEGFYSLNVSVSDGKFSVSTGVRVHVWAAEQRVLDSGLTLQLAGLSAEEFLGDHWRGLQRSLGQALGVPRQELHLAGLQQHPDTSALDALLVWRPGSGAIQSLPTQRIAGVISDLEDSLGLSILRVNHNGCLGSGCPPRRCRNAVRLSGDSLNHFTTARAGYITPLHTWESVCPCNGRRTCQPAACAMLFHNGASLPAVCVSESAIRLEASSYLRYLHGMDEDTQSFNLSLSFKTFQQNGLIVSTNSSKDWGALQLTNGALSFSFTCGGGAPGSLLVPSAHLSDGRWHRVLLEVGASSLRLTADGLPAAAAALAVPCRMLRSHGALLFASPDSAHHPHGFTGCLEHLELNGRPIAVGDSRCPLRNQTGVQEKLLAGSPSVSNPRRLSPARWGTGSNLWVCLFYCAVPHCSCVGLHHGARCELTDNPCASQPCPDHRVCVPKAQGYQCNCTEDRADARYTHTLTHTHTHTHTHCKFSCSHTFGHVEVMEIGAGVLGLLFLVGMFVCVRKRYVQTFPDLRLWRVSNQITLTPLCSLRYFPPSLTKSMKDGSLEGSPIEMSSLAGVNDLDHTPFRSLRPRSYVGSPGGRSPKTQGPVVCSVAPNLPARPPSSSDNDSIRKGHWDREYEGEWSCGSIPTETSRNLEVRTKPPPPQVQHL